MKDEIIMKYKFYIKKLTPYSIYINRTVQNAVESQHVKKISNTLVKIITGKYKPNLCVSMPPRTGKSRLITLSFPLWLILYYKALDRDINILIVNYSQDLANNFGLLLRQLCIDNSDLLAKEGLYLSRKAYSKSEFYFEDEDGKLCSSIKLTGVGGAITGRDVDICILDDYIKNLEDTTPHNLNKLWDWFTAVLLQRLMPDSHLFILATRWSTKDIIGRLKDSNDEDYRFVELKAIRHDGSSLWPERFPVSFFEKKRKRMGDRMFSSLYQCTPYDLTSNYFNLEKLQYNKPLINPQATVRAWDLGYSADGDFTVGIKAIKDDEGNFYIQDMVRGRFQSKNKNIIYKTAQSDNKIADDGFSEIVPVAIEFKGAAAGKLLKDEWDEAMKPYTVIELPAIKSKEDRAFPLSIALEDGRVICNLPLESASLLTEEFSKFPDGENDDIVDAVAHAYNYLFRTNTETFQYAFIDFGY
jgi:phage terminase large subunit-like protein